MQQDVISLKIEPKLHLSLEKFAKTQDRSKSYILRKALESYLEDQKDLRDGLKALAEHKKSKKKTVSLNHLIKKYGLDN